MKRKKANPFGIECYICKESIRSSDVVTLVDLPDGRVGVVHVHHRGVPDLIERPEHVHAGSSVIEAVRLTHEKGSPAAAIRAMRESS